MSVFCKDCKHYRASINSPALYIPGQCERPQLGRCLVTGAANSSDPYKERTSEDENSCGREGKFYEPADRSGWLYSVRGRL
jgi:hypothetical protein